MGQAKYAAVPQAATEDGSGVEEDALDAAGLDRTRRSSSSSSSPSRYELAKKALFYASVAILALVLGFCLGREHEHRRMAASPSPATSALPGSVGGNKGLLSPQALIPEVPIKAVEFSFPTPYEDPGVEGDKLWNALMPIGSGFVRVPYPRRYDMPASKTIEDDPEEAEIYSLSMLHQLHCLGVVRDVIQKYEQHSKSGFAGAGHEYHCIDYIRQSIMCAGDTTLDFAELHEDGTRKGFSGTNSTHQCRDWDTIVDWAVENRAGDKKGIA